MKKNYLLIFLSFFSANIQSQKKTLKCEKVYDAIKLIDSEKYDDAITILRECEKIDPKEYTYPYEIALAYTFNKDHQKAIEELEKIKNYENIKADYYQLLGNNFDYLGKPDLAIATYDEGLKKFPNAGRLYLEKGVMYEFEKPIEAIKIYEKGIEAEPMYPSNYYRAAKVYLRTNDRLSGLMYGEIFMNIERTTRRTEEMSKLLFEGYKKSLVFTSKTEQKTEFCPSVIDVNVYDKSKTLPLCINFAYAFIIAMMNHNEFNYNSLTQMRKDFLKEYSNINMKKNPNVLLNYFKTMDDNKIFNAYNHYLFQVGNEDAFAEWKAKNKDEYERFINWYTTTENYLQIDSKNIYISDQIK
ncbi:tetratricopeptide repeat protein [Chryseobacterium terrae]|uniref:Tetratricopeptide repeat-containing protein n=1 Tax=Chryseobacterium terrae TaxID=3163299 RepID=A0ABW8Y1L7_9FLAO